MSDVTRSEDTVRTIAQSEARSNAELQEQALAVQFVMGGFFSA